MKKTLFLGWLIVFLPALLFAQEKVEAPIWNVGDKWDFGKDGFLEVVGNEKNGYVAKFSAGIFLKSAQGVVIFDNKTFNVLFILEGDKAKKYSKGHRRILNFPFMIGKKWKDEYRRIQPDGFHGGPVMETIKVLGWEQIVAPAGKFKAIKLEYKTNYGPPGLGPISEDLAWYWYSPEVKYFVQGQYGKGYRETIMPMDQSHKGGRDDWKLISLKLKE